MAIKDAGEMPETEAGDDCLSLLQKLEHKEILEILSDGLFCQHCEGLLQSRIQNILFNRKVNGSNESAVSLSSSKDSSKSLTTVSHREQNSPWSSVRTPDSVYSGRQKSYAAANMSPASVNGKHNFLNSMGLVVDGGISEEDDRIRFSQVGRKKDFVYMERVNGRQMNVLQGLELHTQVFNAEEQKRIVECVYNFQRMGQEGRLRARTYSEPRKWMRGKGRVTIQFGCCYNYAVDKNGNPPGIMREEEVDPLPPLFKRMIKRMVRWHVLPTTCVPNSCIVNVYDEGDCIPPHIDHHDFLRPFCTVSFLTECNILFGSNLKIVDAGEFSGPVSLSLPVGSVLILSGNGADKAKHCVPAVPGKRISITFRKMDESKLPHSFLPDLELLGIKPLAYSSASRSPVQQSPHQENQHQNGSHSHDRSGQPLAYSASRSPVQQSARQERQHQNGSPVQQSQCQEKQNQNGGLSHDQSGVIGEIDSKSNSLVVEKNDFPPLGSSNSGNRKRVGSGWLKK